MELLYAKYNRHRLTPFQLETSLWQDQTRKFALKKALCPDAIPHLQRLREQVDPIRQSLHGDRLRLPEVTFLDEQTLRFDFVEGRSLDALLFSAFLAQDKVRFLGIIADYQALLQNTFTTVPTPVFTPAMQQVFGLSSPAELDGLGPFLTPALVDLVFENIIMNDECCYLIDHEWVFEGCLPVAFVLFRSLFYFYEKNRAFGIEAWMTLPAVLEHLAISPMTAGRYREMDEAFQSHVFGRERCYRYKDRYAQSVQSVPSLLATIEYQRQEARECRAEIERLRQVIDSMQNSRGWQLIQKTGRLINTLFPTDTRRRRVLVRIVPGLFGARPLAG